MRWWLITPGGEIPEPGGPITVGASVDANDVTSECVLALSRCIIESSISVLNVAPLLLLLQKDKCDRGSPRAKAGFRRRECTGNDCAAASGWRQGNGTLGKHASKMLGRSLEFGIEYIHGLSCTELRTFLAALGHNDRKQHVPMVVKCPRRSTLSHQTERSGACSSIPGSRQRSLTGHYIMDAVTGSAHDEQR